MRTRRGARRLPTIVGVAMSSAVSLALVGCSTSVAEPNAAGGSTYRIGVMAPETGTHGADGDQVRIGVELAVADLQRSGVLGPDELEPVYVDNQAAPDVAVSGFNQMVSLDRPIASITNFSGPTLAITPIAARQHVPLLNSSAVSPSLAGASPYLFNVVPLMDVQVNTLMKYLAEGHVAGHVALMYSNDALGQATAATFQHSVEAAGLTYSGAVAFDATSADYRAALAKVQSLHPDAVYTTGSASQPGNTIRQAQQLGFTPLWMGYSGFGHQESISIGGAAAQKSLFTMPAVIDAGTGEYFPEYQTFLEAYEERAGNSQPDYLVQSAYECVELVAHAIVTVEGRHQPVTGESVRQAIQDTSEFRSLFGPIEVRPDGGLVQSLSVQQVEGDEFVTERSFGVDEIAALMEEAGRAKPAS